MQVLTGDGELGHPAGASYDRIVATASVRRIPPAWIHQLRPGGVLVAPLDTPWGHDVLVPDRRRHRPRRKPRRRTGHLHARTRTTKPRPVHGDLGWPEDAGA
ncbi:hypothetical protein OOK13_44630 [Streptomyces sp. NBC_00378]|uniref:protein-L-isoaspartate O-methyltransferase family protein n=1 Tax=unclassified Streptomyces TaxID=2593676 RepID=UPI0022598BF0|nr:MULTISPECIES: hypothetical protein [unclassified Streptomyces]MCX5115393.1 hypothetical protein [Streptomyces sp. NBC_00378]